MLDNIKDEEIKEKVATESDDTEADATVIASKETSTEEASTDSTTTETSEEEEVTNQSTEEANEASTEDDKPNFNVEEWGSTGSEVGDSVLRLLNEGGVTPEESKALLYDAVLAGDPSSINRDTLVEKVGADRANLIMAGVTNFINDNTSRKEAYVKTVHDAVGGKENWDTMLPWVNALPEEDAAEYIALLDQGGLQAKLAVKDLFNRYNADPKNTSLAKTELIGTSGVGKSVVEGISKQEYGRQLLILSNRNKATPQALEKLKAQRLAGKRSGL